MRPRNSTRSRAQSSPASRARAACTASRDSTGTWCAAIETAARGTTSTSSTQAESARKKALAGCRVEVEIQVESARRVVR